jgi:hypothetical protein
MLFLDPQESKEPRISGESHLTTPRKSPTHPSSSKAPGASAIVSESRPRIAPRESKHRFEWLPANSGSLLVQAKAIESSTKLPAQKLWDRASADEILAVLEIRKTRFPHRTRAGTRASGWSHERASVPAAMRRRGGTPAASRLRATHRSHEDLVQTEYAQPKAIAEQLARRPVRRFCSARPEPATRRPSSASGRLPRAPVRHPRRSGRRPPRD